MSLIVAKVKKILPSQNFISKKDGQPKVKHFFLAETQEQYPKTIHMTCWGDAWDSLAIQEGATYNFSIDIASREYNERWYTDIQCWKAEPIEQQPRVHAPIPSPSPAPTTASPLPPPPPTQGVGDAKPPF